MGPGGPGGAKLDEKTRKKMEKEEEAIRAAAKALEKREKEEAKVKGEGAKGKGKEAWYVAWMWREFDDADVLLFSLGVALARSRT